MGVENIDVNQMAIKIAEQVSSELDVRIAIIGLIGVIVGSILPIIGNAIMHFFENKPKKILDKKRKEMLTEMLEKDPEDWRRLSTLSSVIGASPVETKRLLISIGARGSETENNVWALIENKPLPTSDDNCI